MGKKKHFSFELTAVTVVGRLSILDCRMIVKQQESRMYEDEIYVRRKAGFSLDDGIFRTERAAIVLITWYEK